MKRIIPVTILFLIFTSFMYLNAQLSWVYGGNDWDEARFIQQTADGGYIVGGNTLSFDTWDKDFWILKLFPDGEIEWQKTYGGNGWDETWWSIRQTIDGGYILAGYTRSFGAGDGDTWVLKLFSNGDIEWQKTYGGNEGDSAESIQQTADGGYILTGFTMSFGAGSADFWVLKLSSVGDVEWQKSYGGNEGDQARSIQQTVDGGYVVTGETVSFGAGDHDFWVLKLSSVGDVEWQKTYGGNEWDAPRSIQQTVDGGYVVAGYTESFGAGSPDFWILKLFSNGDVEWQKTYGGNAWDSAKSIHQIVDGGYIVAGTTESFGAGESDIWVLKLFSNGDIEWQKTYGGRNTEWGSIQKTADGGYIVAGSTDSFGFGRLNILILKLSSEGESEPAGLSKESNATVSDTSISPFTTIVIPVDSNIFPQDTDVVPWDSNVNVLPLFSQYTLTIAADTGGTTNPSPGSYVRDFGTEVSVTAVPNSGYQFNGWSGDAAGTANPITITMDSDKSITASFIWQYTLTIAAETGGTTNPSPGSYDYGSGTQVSVTAEPGEGQQFSGWSGDASGTTNPITITMDSDKSIIASFSVTTEEKKGGCFIATAAYNNPQHPHVSILRDFQDKYLLPSRVGRALVNQYYKYSPFMASVVAKHRTLKIAAQISLLPFVAFSYFMVHFGPIATAVIFAFIFVLPIFFIWFYPRRFRILELKFEKREK